jgi:hypothetical protein
MQRCVEGFNSGVKVLINIFFINTYALEYRSVNQGEY